MLTQNWGSVDMPEFLVKTLRDWVSVADAVAARLKPGEVLALSGPLGAGKTTFVQALAAVLGSRARPKSPTFSLVRSYPLDGKKGVRRLLHVDAYRLEAPEDLLPLNLDEELAEPGTVVAIEWPENAETWIARRWPNVVKLVISPEGTTRRVQLA